MLATGPPTRNQTETPCRAECAGLHYDGRHREIVDLNSLGGTYDDGARVVRHVLRPGDQIQVGQAVLVFQQGVGQG